MSRRVQYAGWWREVLLQNCPWLPCRGASKRLSKKQSQPLTSWSIHGEGESQASGFPPPVSGFFLLLILGCAPTFKTPSTAQALGCSHCTGEN